MSPCNNRKTHRAERAEALVWELVSELLTDPERVRAGLEEIDDRARAQPVCTYGDVSLRNSKPANYSGLTFRALLTEEGTRRVELARI